MSQRNPPMPPSSSNEDSDGKKAKYLPRVNKTALWSNAAGLVTTPNTKRLPPEPPQDRPGNFDYSRPRLLDDAHMYWAFYPRLPHNRGEIFGRLDVTAESLGSKVVKYSQPYGFRADRTWGLAKDLQDSWYRLETTLLHITSYLWHHHRHRSSFAEIALPETPESFGYRQCHRTPQIAVRCALRARDAFTMLGALLTFILTLGLGNYEHDCFESAFQSLLGQQEKLGINRTWLTWLQESYVCNLAFGLRAGAIIDPYRFGWGMFVPKFVAAGVPHWFVWGDEQQQLNVFSIKDQNFVKHLFPPFEVQRRAERRAQTRLVAPYEPMTVLPSHYDLLDRGAEDFDQPERDDFETEVNDDAPAHPSIPYGTVERHSLQRQGEHYADFFARMNVRRADSIENENFREKQSREDMERLAAKQIYSPKTTVFLWREEQGFWRREALIKSEVEIHWDDYTPNQRRFLGHLKQWDLCPMYPTFEEGAPKTIPRAQFYDEDDDDGDDDSDDDIPHVANPKLTLDDTDLLVPREARAEYNATRDVAKVLEDRNVVVPPEARAEYDAAMDVETLPEHGEVESGGEQASAYPTEFKVFLAFLRNRLGYVPRRNVYPDRHSGDSDKRAKNPSDVLKGLGHEKLGLPAHYMSTMLDFHDTLVNDGLPLNDFPSPWDINPSYADCLKLRKPGFELHVLRGPRSNLYAISDDDKGRHWVVALSDPTVVLLIYRKADRWNSLPELVRFLLEQRVPFQMPHLVNQRDVGRAANKTHSYGLGGRGYQWKATDQDFREYELRRKAVFQSPLGRAFRLLGGLVGRMAEEYVSTQSVLEGPTYFNKILAKFDDGSGQVLAEDDIPLEDEDIVCGAYYVNITRGGGTVGICSWWPRLNRWENCGFDLGQWLPDAEKMYQFRLEKLRSKPLAADLHASSVWKTKLRFHMPRSNRMLEPARELARKFILGDSRVEEIQSLPSQSHKRRRVR